MLLSQIRDKTGKVCVVVRDGTEAYAVKGASSVYDLARKAAGSGTGLAARIRELGLGEAVDLEAAYDEGRLMLPITHPDPAHMHVTGTGLTHLGSAATRDAMHADAAAPEKAENLTELDEDVPHGPARRQTSSGRGRRAA